MSRIAENKLVKIPRAEQWANQICTQLGKSVESIIEAGRLLVEAKSDLPHGEWGRLFSDGLLPFTRQTAFKLMAVSEHPQLSNVAHVQHLPPSWGTLYELSRVEPKRLTAALKDGTVTPDMKRKAVVALLPPPKAKNGHKPATVEIISLSPGEKCFLEVKDILMDTFHDLDLDSKRDLVGLLRQLIARLDKKLEDQTT